MESFSDTQEEVEVQNGWLHLSRLQLRSREGIWWFAPWNVTKKESVRLFINFMDLLDSFWVDSFSMLFRSAFILIDLIAIDGVKSHQEMFQLSAILFGPWQAHQEMQARQG